MALLPATALAGAPLGAGDPAPTAGILLVEDGVQVWAGDSRPPTLPRLEAGPGSGVHVQRSWQTDPQGWRLVLGVSALQVEGQSRLLAEGSELSVPVLGGRLYASQQRRHWGPGMNSLFLDGQALPVGAVGWRREERRQARTPWLRWLGAWSADFFVGSLHGHERPRHPWLIGMRVDLEPVGGLTIGLTRTLLWGGQGRDRSWKSLGRALIGHDNTGDDGVDLANQPGNQLAGIDLRLEGGWGEGGGDDRRRWSVYGQAAGEDESGNMPSKFLLLAGAAVGMGAWQVEAEWADTGMRHAYGDHQPGAYRHEAFARAYTHFGTTLGHPIGGDAVLQTLAARHTSATMQTRVAVHRGRALAGSQYFQEGERLNGLSVALQSAPRASWHWSAAVNLLRHGARTDTAVQLGFGRGW